MKTAKKDFKSSSDVQYKPHHLFCYNCDINNVLTGNEMISVLFFVFTSFDHQPTSRGFGASRSTENIW